MPPQGNVCRAVQICLHVQRDLANLAMTRVRRCLQGKTRDYAPLERRAVSATASPCFSGTFVSLEEPQYQGGTDASFWVVALCAWTWPQPPNGSEYRVVRTWRYIGLARRSSTRTLTRCGPGLLRRGRRIRVVGGCLALRTRRLLSNLCHVACESSGRWGVVRSRKGGDERERGEESARVQGEKGAWLSWARESTAAQKGNCV